MKSAVHVSVNDLQAILFLVALFGIAIVMFRGKK
jgi:hypothetical protein